MFLKTRQRRHIAITSLTDDCMSTFDMQLPEKGVVCRVHILNKYRWNYIGKVTLSQQRWKVW